MFSFTSAQIRRERKPVVDPQGQFALLKRVVNLQREHRVRGGLTRGP